MQEVLEKVRYFEKETLKKFNKTKFFYRKEYEKIDNINFQNIGITGLRGIGKTSYLLKKRKEKKNSMYISCDWSFLLGIDVFEFIIYVYKNFGIDIFILDEIQFINGWSAILKNIFDVFDITIIFSGSSKIVLESLSNDLSRRVIIKNLYPFGYQEYIKYKYNKDISFSFDDIIKNHMQLSFDYNSFFEKEVDKKEYMSFGEFGYFYSGVKNEDFYFLLNNSLKKSVFEDIPKIASLDSRNIIKIENLLYYIANMGASDISINKLSGKIGIDNKIILLYLQYLEKLGWIKLLEKHGNIGDSIRKDKKIYILSNNLSRYLSNKENSKNIGKERETFFLLHMLKTLKEKDCIQFKSRSDFVVYKDGKEYIFEIGGKNKKKNNYSENTLIVKDDILISEDKQTVPLWLFGLIN